MITTIEQIKQQLKMKNINLSHQRLKVLGFLIQNHCHPTVEQIYTALEKDIPTLSKTTVYNTLRVLADAGLVRIITIEDNEVRFDINTEDHGHFKCESCGTIFDFNTNIDVLVFEDLENFQINDKNVYFKGICPRCRLTKKENS